MWPLWFIYKHPVVTTTAPDMIRRWIRSGSRLADVQWHQSHRWKRCRVPSDPRGDFGEKEVVSRFPTTRPSVETDFFPGGFSASIRKVIWKKSFNKIFLGKETPWECIYLPIHEWLIFMVNVSKYTSSMDPMGMSVLSASRWEYKMLALKPRALLDMSGFVSSSQDNLQKTMERQNGKRTNFGLGWIPSGKLT